MEHILGDQNNPMAASSTSAARFQLQLKAYLPQDHFKQPTLKSVELKDSKERNSDL